MELLPTDHNEIDIDVLKNGDIALLLGKALEDVDLGGDKYLSISSIFPIYFFKCGEFP